MRKPLQNTNIQGLLVLSSVLVIAMLFILNNQQPEQSIGRPQQPPSATAGQSVWMELNSLPSATPAPQVTLTPFVPPTLPGVTSTSVAVNAASIPLPTNTPAAIVAVTPTPFFTNSTPLPLPTGIALAANPDIDANPQEFDYPPELVPLSAHPFDHFWLSRPIDVGANSRSLFYYPYGSSGQGWRVHHGLDMPNPPGEEVHAAGAGIVVWAGSRDDLPADESAVVGDLQVFPSYGSFVVIEHNFGIQGANVWTLYAHLSAILTAEGAIVESGDVIGLVGASGNVTGPHVHFEVRVGSNEYYSTRNPMLWMAPFIGHGVVAGKVIDAEGRYIDNVLIQLNRDGRVTDSTTTYINPFEPGKRFWNVVPDSNWQENFVLGDIPAGEYQLVALVENERIFQPITVQAGITTFVTIQVDVEATPQPFTTQTVIPTAIFPTLPPTSIPTATP